MPLKDILVGLDPSSAGESRLKLALNLARAHRAYLIACCVTGENHAAPVNQAGPGLLVAPEPGSARRARSEDGHWRTRICLASDIP